MPPRLDPGRVTKIDGDHQRVKDYDVKENETKKKFTYFYTKQELEDIEQKKQNSIMNHGMDFGKNKHSVENGMLNRN